MPVRLIVTNNGDRPITLRDARILFYTAAGDRIQAAEPEDVERLMTRKEREGGKIPMPGPLPNIKLKPKASNKEIEQDFDTFEYRRWWSSRTPRAPASSSTMSPSSTTRSGRQAAPAQAARRRRQRAVLLRDSLRQVPQVEVQPDELSACCDDAYS